MKKKTIIPLQLRVENQANPSAKQDSLVFNKYPEKAPFSDHLSLGWTKDSGDRRVRFSLCKEEFYRLMSQKQKGSVHLFVKRDDLRKL